MVNLECTQYDRWTPEITAAWKAVFAEKKLGFWQLPDRDDNWELAARTAKRLRSRFDRLIVLGMGGSGLGGQLLVQAAAPLENVSTVHFVANSDPDSFLCLLDNVTEPAKTGWLVISKSGSTLEVASLLMQARDFYKAKGWNLAAVTTVVTEPKDNPLSLWAKQNDIPIVDHPLDVGGRFSALSPVGLVPAAFAGVDLVALRKGALRAKESQDLVARFVSGVLESFHRDERITVFWSYIERLDALLPWLQQLWAESLGKSDENPASSPILSFGTKDQHSVLQQYMEGADDKYFVFLLSRQLAKLGAPLQNVDIKGFEYLNGQSIGTIFDAEARATAQALRNSGRQTCAFEVDTVDTATVGFFILYFELVIGVLGGVLGLDAYNQPGVEAGKIIARASLSTSMGAPR